MSKTNIPDLCLADPAEILSILDRCCESFTFPMLDNGYIYLAATRLSLYRSSTDWAMVVEVFGFSPRAGLPDTNLYTFASKLRNRAKAEDYANREAYENYLTNNPNNESEFVYPVGEGPWLDGESVAEEATDIVLRGRTLALPSRDEYVRHSIELEEPQQVLVFELCRYLADVAREDVLATAQERRINVLPEMVQILQLEEWNHPNLVEEELTSSSETFQQLAQVLATGDISLYRPTLPSNTHWKNWPDGGTL